MADIANRNGRNIVQYILLPLKSFNFLIFNDFKKFYIDSHFENFKNKEHNFE